MAVKYHCPACTPDSGRRWVDWGAEKIKFKCPDCGKDLIQVGKNFDSAPSPKPTLKRKKKVAPPPPPPVPSYDDDPPAPDLDEIAPAESGEEPDLALADREVPEADFDTVAVVPGTGDDAVGPVAASDADDDEDD